MKAMVLARPGARLVMEERPDPVPGPGQARLRMLACGVCRTDLHLLDGELPQATFPRIPGHEIVGEVEALGEGGSLALGQRVGVGWLGRACGVCPYCRSDRENLCDNPVFTGCNRDGGFASHVIVDQAFAYALPAPADPVPQAPLLCAGLIGWRTLVFAGEGKALGLYGFGAAGHIIAQVAHWQGRRVFVFTRPGDDDAQRFAHDMGADWVGASGETPPEPLDAAIIYAAVGDLVPDALRAVGKGGRVVCGGIHMSDIPAFPYEILWGERQVISVANLTRADARAFLDIAPKAHVVTEVTRFALEQANEALAAIRAGELRGAAVLTP